MFSWCFIIFLLIISKLFPNCKVEKSVPYAVAAIPCQFHNGGFQHSSFQTSLIVVLGQNMNQSTIFSVSIRVLRKLLFGRKLVQQFNQILFILY